MREHEGRVVVITGGASGIGLATAQRLSSAGASVITLDVSPSTSPLVAGHMMVDITDVGGTQEAFQKIGDTYGRIDVLVNNAGIGAVGTFEEGDVDEWRRVFDVNLYGLLNASRAAVGHLRQSESGAIVNVSSLVAHAGIPKRAAYSASKGAVQALTLSMAADLLSDRIRVNAVAPGTTGTPWVERLLVQADNEVQERHRLEARQPMGRLGAAEEIAAVIAFLGSKSASFVTGSVWTVDGGMAGLRIPDRAGERG